MRKLPLILFLLMTFGVAPVLAIFGAGDIVFDPQNFEEAIQQLAELEKQYQQLTETYQMVRSQYQQMVWMSKQDPVNMIQRYLAKASAWIPATPSDTYGTGARWIDSINHGLNALSGYNASTQKLLSYDSAFANIPADQSDRVKNDYATVELTDGANVSAIQTIGEIRENAPLVENAIANLESDSLSSDPAMNTEIAVLNKINAANVISLRNAQDANKVLVSLAEQQIVQAKRQRDAEAQAFNQDIQFRSQGRQVMAEQAAGASSAMLAWRMP